MIWDRKVKDVFRWRKCFALFPTRIGDRRVWLGRYAWRYLKADEKEQYRYDNPLSAPFSREFRLYALRSGYTMVREQVGGFSGMVWANRWHEI